MGVKFPENSLGHNEISTWKPYKTKPFGGENEQFSRTSCFMLKIEPKSVATDLAQTLRLSMFQSLIRGAANQIEPPLKCIDTAIEGISSYIYPGR